MVLFFLVVPVRIETTVDLHHLGLYAHHGKPTTVLWSKKFKNQQYLNIEFWFFSDIYYQIVNIVPKWKWQETWSLPHFSE